MLPYSTQRQFFFFFSPFLHYAPPYHVLVVIVSNFFARLLLTTCRFFGLSPECHPLSYNLLDTFFGDTTRETIISQIQSYESIKDLELGLNFHPFYEGFLRISHKVTQVRAFPIKTLMMSKSAYSWERANLNPGWFLLPFTTCISSLQYWSFTSSWFRLAESSMHKNSSGSFHHLAASHGFYNKVEEYCHFHAKM